MPKNNKPQQAASNADLQSGLHDAETDSRKHQLQEDDYLTAQSFKTEESLMRHFSDVVKDIYRTENHFAKALFKTVRNDVEQAIANPVIDYLKQAKTNVERLQHVFEMLGRKAGDAKSGSLLIDNLGITHVASILAQSLQREYGLNIAD
ncbi:MAG TPA: DUF892 family protein [Parafilimonas sp.]|nr:DUF892 family protein [Parafilimonas sp.]